MRNIFQGWNKSFKETKVKRDQEKFQKAVKEEL
jgi:hypothetical protein